MIQEDETHFIPQSFLWKRIHSLTGLWFVLFLIVHLFTNSQAALLVADEKSGFVQAVNSIRALPFLQVIEITLLGVPFLIHAWWGVKYLFTSQSNVLPSDGSTPSLPQYPRNQAYTWQRITSWILLVGIVAHVIHMRFLEYPTVINVGHTNQYQVALTEDEGLKNLQERLNFTVQGANDIMIATTKDFGTAELLMVRNAFKNPLLIFLYTVLVLAACFHGFNGLWTFMIRWGITLSVHGQKIMRRIAVSLMVLVSFLGLAAIWGSYWIKTL